MPPLLPSRPRERVMWQEEALQTDIGPWNVLYPSLLESSLETAFGCTTDKLQPRIEARSNITLLNNNNNNNNIGSWSTAAGLVQSPPSFNSEGSCTTSLSESAGSPSRKCLSKNLLKERSFVEKMNNSVTSAGSHVIDDDPEATSPPIGAGNNWWTSMLLSNTQSQPSASVNGSIPELETMNWSSDLPTAAPACDMVGQHPHSLGMQPTSNSSTITADCHQHMSGVSNSLLDSSLSMASSLVGVADNSLWNQVFLGGASSEAMQSLQNCTAEGLQDILLSRALRHGNEFLLPDHLKKVEEMQTWDLPLKNFTFQGDEMSLSTMDQKHTPTQLQYPQLVDDRLSSTASTLSDMETWTSAAQDHNHAVSQSAAMNAFTAGLELPNASHFDQSRVKQEYPVSYGCNSPSTTSPYWLQGFNGLEAYKSDSISSQLLECGNKPIFKTLAAGSSLTASSIGAEEFPARWPPAHPSRFPTTIQHGLPLGPISKQPAHMIAFGNSIPRHTLDLTSLRLDARQQVLHGTATDRSSPLQYSLEGKQSHDSPSSMRAMGHVDDGREAASDQKRNAGSVNTCESISEGLFKRPRVESTPPTLPFKQQVRKEKLGDRITALQQLVSPFGKTDTASVLLEAIGYIKFLQEQVQVLSTPYMKNTSTTTSQNDPGKKAWNTDKSQDTDEPKQDLRSRGLCLVPVSCTQHVANDNGADYWAPTLGGGYR